MIHHRSFILALSMVLSVFLCGCGKAPEATSNRSQAPAKTKDPEHSQWVGERVRVQFRRDALGAAATLPISPTTGSINGASTTIVGTLTSVEANAIVVDSDNRPKWIPREVILFVELNP